MIGGRTWVIPEGFIPTGSFSERPAPISPAPISHDAACILNCPDAAADIEITLYFEDREPVGPYRLRVGARRTMHMRFNDLDAPERVPRGANYASVFRTSAPILVQQTRLDSRDPHISLMTTMACPVAAAS